MQLTSLKLLNIVAREPADLPVADSLPPSTINHLRHCHQVTFLKLKLKRGRRRKRRREIDRRREEEEWWMGI